MPIEYAPETHWPPAEAAAAWHFYREWLAWYGGDPDDLHKLYAGYSRVAAPHVRPAQLNGGASGWVARKWWGNPIYGAAARRMHVPAAADVATISSDMLFSEPPDLDLRGGADSTALDEMIEESMLLPTLAEAAEWQSAAGGVLVRVSVNRNVSPLPVFEAMLPDNSIPTFYGPHLSTITLWRTVSADGATPVLRHLEHHEIGPKGLVVVSHALFQGATDRLGQRVPLTDGDDECRRLAKLVDANGEIVVPASRLDVVYVPNVRPHRLLRNTMLGRSDFMGSEPSMDALDESMTSWMRDIRLAKARIIVPREYIRTPGGEGKGGVWDPEQEILQQINAPSPSDGPLSITPVQFTIRVQEHRDTVAAHWRTITSSAGLDTSDHDTQNGPQQTATQVNDKGSRKRATRGKKIKYWTPALRHMLWVGQELMDAPPQPVDVEWPDAAAPDMQTMAQTLQLLAAAGAASTQTLVAMLHPDWRQAEIETEVARIDKAMSAPTDPATFMDAAGSLEPDAGQP